MQLSDRRLTTPTGGIFTEDETKVVYVRTPTLQLLMGYTGLATIGREPTNRILMELMGKALEESALETGATIERFVELLTETWKERRVQAAGAVNTRLSIVLTAFELLGDGKSAGPYQCFVTNFQDWTVSDELVPWPEFRSLYRNPQEEWSVSVQRIGAYDALPPSEIEKLRTLLKPGVPPEAVRDSMLSLLPAQSAAFPTVGTRANSVILRPHQEPEGSYHSFNEVRSIQHFDQVIATSPTEILMVSQATITQEARGPGFITEVPRRQPCSCGSGIQYRRCHGKKPSAASGIIFPASSPKGG